MHCIATHSTSQHIFLKLTTLFATYLRLVLWTPSVPETPSFNSTNINIIAFHLCAPPLCAHFHCALTVADYAPVCNIYLCSSLFEHKRWWWLRAIISLRSEIYWVTHNHTIHMSSWVESDTTTFVCNPFVHCYCKWILKITLAFVGCRIEAICIYHMRTVETRSRVTQSQWTKHRTHTHRLWYKQELHVGSCNIYRTDELYIGEFVFGMHGGCLLLMLRQKRLCAINNLQN